MPKIISSTELRNEYNEISSWCRETNEPAFVTKNGAGDIAVMSMQAYDEMRARVELYEFVERGRQDILARRTVAARDHLAELRKSLQENSDNKA